MNRWMSDSLILLPMAADSVNSHLAAPDVCSKALPASYFFG